MPWRRGWANQNRRHHQAFNLHSRSCQLCPSPQEGTLKLYQSTIGWYALHIIRPSYHKLQTSQKVLGAQVHYVQWYKWPIWSSAALPTIDDIGYWEWCAALQGLSCKPSRFDLVMVSSPPSKLHQFILGCFWGICRPLLMFYTLKTKYKHLAEY